MTSRNCKSHSIGSKTFFAALLLFTATLFAQTRPFITIDAPGATSETLAASINNAGVIAGYYADSAGLTHGFVRDVSGAFTEFTPVGIRGITVQSINLRGQVIGFGGTSTNSLVGFLRATNGQIVPISVPGAAGTQPSGINDAGQVVGTYSDSASGFHGFLWDHSAGFTLFDDPDAIVANGTGTVAVAINNNGVITGYYTDASTGFQRAFIRDQFGNFTNFDAASASAVFTNPTAINLSGEIAGTYEIGIGGALHGFLRDASGNVTDFDVPNSTGTSVHDLNDSGQIVGQWSNFFSSSLGFGRNALGTFFSISPPLSNGTTFPTSINNAGRITGYYFDDNRVIHGFLR